MQKMALKPYPPHLARLLALLLGLMLGLAACSPKTQAAKFYLLQPMARADKPESEASAAWMIGVGPVEMPAYLDRPQIVTGGAGAEMQLDEFQRWAEPLKDNATHVLAENLSLLMPGQHVLPFPWNRNLNLDYQVEIQIIRFHVDGNGLSELKANWSILRQNKPVLMKEFLHKAQAAGADYDAKVAAQSQALAAFSRAIAEGLRGSSQGR